uniref:TIDP3108 n=1 Tax=Arundo donax TaxID=35708 RepID=A0A0A9G561_ARUDO
MDDPADASVDTSGDTAGMSLDEKLAVLRNIWVECINEDELQLLLNKNAALLCYVWFVPSPSMHIAQEIMKTNYVNKMINAGYTVKILIADWFAQMDYKIGSDLNKIRTIGSYNIEVWKAVGMNLDRVEFVWLSDVMNCHAANIWPLVMDIGQKTL